MYHPVFGLDHDYLAIDLGKTTCLVPTGMTRMQERLKSKSEMILLVVLAAV